jgi:NAD+ diphosphatase
MKEPNFYAAGGLDRVGHRRKDAAWLAERLAHASSRFIPVWRSQNLIVTGDAPRAALLARHEITGAGG